MIVKNKFIEQSQGQRLKYARQLTTLSAIDFSKTHNIAYNTLIAWEYDRRNLSQSKATYLISCLNTHRVFCSEDWLLSGAGHPPSVNSNTPNSTLEEMQPTELSLFSEIDYFKKCNPNALTVVIQDDAMLPFFEIGDYVGGVPFEVEQYNGSFCIVKDGSETRVRRLYSISDDEISLVAINSSSRARSPVNMSLTDQQIYRIVYHRKP